MNDANTILGLSFVTFAVIGLGSVAIYFAPTALAAARNKHNTPAIFALNILLGWTCIGWVVAFVWACANDA